MGLEKAIKFGKEKRKPYRGGKAVSNSCRNHGNCEYCKQNRLYSFKKSKDKWNVTNEELKEIRGE